MDTTKKTFKAMDITDYRNADDNEFEEEVYEYQDDGCEGSYMNFIFSPTLQELLQKYDEIIFCTGWLFDDSIFEFKINLTKDKKYPEISSNFESINHKNLYFIGTIGHSLDKKKSSGGFIHGFRYLIQFFLRINYDIPFIKTFIPYNNDFSCYDILKNKIVTRINTASSIYQMFGVITDIFYYDDLGHDHDGGGGDDGNGDDDDEHDDDHDENDKNKS